MRFPPRWFWLVLLSGLVIRLLVAALAPHPGIADPNHYYNLANNLANGRGFVIDYIWQYHQPPVDLTHPIDYWMPLPALYPAIGLAIAPGNLFVALLPSVIFGTALLALTYGMTTVIGASKLTGLMAMLAVGFVPEFILNSARTDTTITYILYFGLTAIFFYLGLRDRPPLLILAGVFAGLTQLSRQDGIIIAPAMLISLFIFWRWGEHSIRWRWVMLIPIAWLGVMSPWLLRNLSLYGVLLPSGASRTLFMTSFIDQFTYGRELTLQYYLDWGLPNILSNWLTQALANIRTTVTVLDIGLPIIGLLGLIGLIRKHEREKLLLLALPLVMIMGLFVFYSFVTPFHTQGGSFKKSYLLIVPFVAVVGAWWLNQYLSSRIMGILFSVVMAGLMLTNALVLVRDDFDLANRFNDSMNAVKADLLARGDVNGDGEIVVMTQDPFVLNYVGFRALMIPSDDRDMILEAAYRYQTDYILLPSGRAALDPLMDDAESDARLRWSESVPGFQLLEVIPQDA